MKCTKCGGEFEGNFCPWCGEPAGTAPGGAAAAGAPAQPQYVGQPPAQPQYGQQPAQTYVPPYAGQNGAVPPYGQPPAQPPAQPSVGQPYEQSPAAYGQPQYVGQPPAQPPYGQQPAQTYVPPYAGQNNAAPPYGQPYEQSPAPYGQPAQAAEGQALWQAAPRWTYGQPRAKSANALGLQWGCFLLFLLLAASAMAFFFLNVFEYSLAGVVAESHSVFGITGLFGGQDAGITEASIFYDYNVYIVLITMLYSIAAFIGVLYLFVCWQSPGNYHRSMRKNILFNASAQAVCSLIAMVLYIVFSNAFFTDMGIAVGSLSVLPYVCFGVNAVLFFCALALFRAKNTDALAYLTVWDTSGLADFCKRHRAAVVTGSGILVAAASLVLFLCYPLYSDGLLTYTLPQVYDMLRLLSGTDAMATARTLCIVVFVLFAVFAALWILVNALGATIRDPDATIRLGYTTGKQKGIVAAMMIAVVVLFAAIYILAIFLPRELDLDGETSAALFELLLLWIVVVLAGSWLSGLAGARLSPDEAKELRLLKRRGGLGTKGKR